MGRMIIGDRMSISWRERMVYAEKWMRLSSLTMSIPLECRS